MFERYFLQIIGIIIIGDFINSLFRKYIFHIDDNQDIIDRIIVSVIFGYASFVIPMLIVGVLFEGHMDKVVYLHYAIALIIVLRGILSIFTSLHRINLKRPKLNFAEGLILFLIIGIIIDYLFLSIIYSERGWDALHYYFPNSIYFYLSNGIPSGFNPFSFFPTFKPPLNSLFITYSFYVADGQQGQTFSNLHPWVLFVTTSLIVYKYTEKITKKRITSLLSQLIFLMYPLSFFLMYEYSYYQDIPVMLFMVATHYFFTKDSSNKNYLAFIASISASLAILSKMSGYTIFLLIILSINFTWVSKYVKLALTWLITIFLIYNTIFEQYVGYGVVIFGIGIILTKLILNQDTTNKFSLSQLGIFSVFPLLLGSFWIWFMNKIPGISDLLLNLYFRTESKSLAWTFEGLNSPYLTYVENGMRVSFEASIFYILTGSTMALTLMLPKLIGLYKNNKDHSLKIFFFVFFMIWLAYYGRVSARYLSPILPALAIFTAIGLQKLSEIISNKIIPYIFKVQPSYDETIIRKIILIFSASLTLYPFIPLENVFNNFNIRIYNYHSNQFILFVYVFFITMLYILSFKFQIKPRKKTYQRFSVVLVTILILLYVGPQIYTLTNSDFDQQKFNTNLNYAERENYRELVSVIINENIQIIQVILTVNTPGLEYYVTRPVADLMLVSYYEGFDAIKLYNTTEAYDFLVDNGIKLIVKLNQGHVFYDVYTRDYSDITLLSVAVNGSNFELLMENEEFSVFKRLHDGELIIEN
jgi:hypothetical protein